MRRDIDEAVRAIATRQAGVFHREDLRGLGGDRHLERRRCRAGVWRHLGGGVLVIAAVPWSFDQSRWIGLVGGGHGAHLGFEAAAELHGLEGARRGSVVVVVRHALHLTLPGVRFRRVDDVAPHHLTEAGGLPVTTVARTIVDLAAVVSDVRLRRLVEDAVTRRLTTFAEIGQVLTELRRHGKPGVSRLVRVLDALGGEPPPASEAERLLLDAARRAGVTVVRQLPLPARAHVRGLVDAGILSSKVILEADSRTWHARMEAMRNDRARDREAARHGWLTLRFMYDDLANDIDGCAEEIHAVHVERRSAPSRVPAVRDAQRSYPSSEAV